jgi:hypothetical protein
MGNVQPPNPGDAHDLRTLLEAVLEAVTLPYDTPDYDRRILNRAAQARVLAVAALAEDPAGLAWNVDFLRQKLAQEQAEAAERENNRCRRCRKPFDPADLRHDGHGRYASTPWCRRCIDNCRDGSAEHVCIICDPQRYGGEGQ